MRRFRFGAGSPSNFLFRLRDLIRGFLGSIPSVLLGANGKLTGAPFPSTSG